MATPTLKAFFESLQRLETFPANEYARKLEQASRYTPAMGQFAQYFPQPDPSQQTATFDGQDCSSRISDLAAVTSARGMALISDDFGFSQIVDRSKALDLAKRMMANLIPFLYGDHVNARLSAAGIPNLQQLRQNSEFVEEYRTTLLRPTFEHLALMHDDAAQNRDYTTNLIFVHEYFNHGPGYNMADEIPAGFSEDVTHWSAIVANWIQICVSPEFLAQYPQVKAAALVPSTTVVYALNGYPDASSQALALTIKESTPELARWDVTDDIRYYTSLGQTVWANWDNVTESYQEAVRQSENQSTSRVYPGTGRFPVSTTVTTYGDGAAAFVSQYKWMGIFTGDPGNRSRTNQGNPFSGACFAPGTKIMTRSRHNIKIEQLKEGTEILTQGGSDPQYGICSDEEVTHPTVGPAGSGHGKMALWGFNEHKPFFTAGHVFHTTTGPRAVDPTIAKEENPWVEVGRLEAGHSLLHTYDGYSYHIVPITRLHFETARCQHVYGVHLRSGLRSYHANGYLVHLNYPEITIKSLSKLLLPMSQRERLRLLASFAELRPLFERFGALTLLEALDGQLRGVDGLPKNLIGKKKHHRMKPGAEHIKRTWVLEDDKPWNTSIKLPTVQAHEGVIHIDGKYVKHAKVSASRVLWSRPIGERLWEHGYLNLRDDLLVGTGALSYSAEGLTPDVSKHEHLRYFSAVPVGPSDVPSALIELSNASRAMTSLQSGPQDLSVGSITAPPYPELEYYQLYWDDAPWKEGNFVPTNPKPYLQIYLTIVGALKNFSARIPVLDKIRDKLCEQTQKDNSIQLPVIPDLYECWNGLDDNGNNVLYFQITGAETLAQAADGLVEDVTKSYQNLRFTNLGLDVEIPFVWDQMRFALSFDGADGVGVIRVYDPAMLAGMGERILLTGNYINPNLTTTMAERRLAIASSTIGNFPDSSLQDMISTHLAPPEFVGVLAAGGQGVPTDNKIGALELATLALDAQTVHDATQRLLYRVMLYHMDENDRNTFTGDAKPTVGNAEDQVPTALASNLDTDIVSWIQKTYVPMWIAKRIISMSDATQNTWREKFSDQEKKKINYFWTGKGKTCLSQSPENNLLNQFCATYALRLVSPRLAQFADDPVKDKDPESSTYGKAGGKRWATQLFEKQASGLAFMQMMLGYNTESALGFNKAQKLCNIFQVLDPIPLKVPDNGWTEENKPFSMKLMDKINVDKQIYGITFKATPYTNDELIELEYQWLFDAMAGLWTALLRGDTGYGDQVSQKLRDDANRMVEALEIDQRKSAEEKALQMAVLTARIIRTTLLLTRTFSKSNIPNRVITGLKGWARAVRGSDQAIAENDNPKLSKALPFLHLAMAVGTMASFIGSAWTSFRDFSSLDDIDRAKLILGTVQTSLVMLSQAKDAWKAFQNNRSAAQTSAAAAAVEQNSPESVGSERQRIFGNREIEQQAYGATDYNGLAVEIEQGSAQNLRQSTGYIDVTEPDLPSRDVKEIPNTEKSGLISESKGTARKLWDNFSISEHGLRVALFLVGASMTIVACIGLAVSWDHLDTVSRVLNVINVVQMSLATIIEGASLILDILQVTEGIASSVCAWAGPILAIIGLAILIAMLIYESKQPPPLTPVEAWIVNNGRAHVDLLPSPPNPKLSWSVTSPLKPGGQDTLLSITGHNTTSIPQTFYSLTTNFFAGTAPSALFTQSEFFEKPKSDALKPGYATYVDSPVASVQNAEFSIAAAGSQTGADGKSQTQYNMGVVAGGADPDVIVVEAGGKVVMEVKGTVGAKGEFALEVQENWVDEKMLPWDLVTVDLVVKKE